MYIALSFDNGMILCISYFMTWWFIKDPDHNEKLRFHGNLLAQIQFLLRPKAVSQMENSCLQIIGASCSEITEIWEANHPSF